MQITKVFAGILMLLCVLAFTAFAGNRDTSADLDVFISASLDPVMQPVTQATTVPQATAYEHAAMEMVASKTWVRERVGVMPLNIFRRPFDTLEALDGYSDVLLRPKITSLFAGNNGRSLNTFTGLGGNHFARADV